MLAPSCYFPRLGRSLLFCAVVTSVAAIVGGCHRERPVDAAIATQTLLLGNAAEPADLDPHAITAWTDSNVDYALFEALTWIDEKTSLAIPAAAQSWEVSADGLVYT